MLSTMEESYRIGEAASVLGVRVETLRRWASSGKLKTTRTVGGQRMVLAGEVARLLSERRDKQGPMAATSARNHFPGVITAIKKDKLVATVEILAGPHRVLALITRESVDELGLRPGMQAVATVKATNVFVELPA
jgi:molybdopterin-binding protein